jgi:hypothetical protein
MIHVVNLENIRIETETNSNRSIKLSTKLTRTGQPTPKIYNEVTSTDKSYQKL